MKKVELTLEQMVEAVNVNVDNPWEVVGIGRSSWFRILRKNGTTMKELQSQSHPLSQPQSMKKVELTLKQMVEAVNVNVDNPWEVVGIGRSSWYRILRKNGTTMKELRSQSHPHSQPQSQSMNKTQKLKRNWRNSKAWKAFRHQMNVLQHGVDPITGSKLAKGANLHHRHVTADTEEYTDISNTDDYVMLNMMTHKMLHFIYTYYKKYGRAVLDRIEEELNRWY